MIPAMMCLALACLLFCAYVAAEVDIPLNPQSSLYDGIKSIKLNDAQRLVTIQLNPVRRCENPTFIVRLSGTALYWLRKVRQDYVPPVRKAGANVMAARRNNFYFQYPPISDSGDYFIEVILLYCTEFDPNNYLNVCLEDYTTRNITLPKAVRLTSTTDLVRLPRWKLPANEEVRFLPTRSQKIQCSLGTDESCKGFPRDVEVASLWQHKLYDWVDGPSWNESVPAGVPHICMVGCSHARDLHAEGHSLDKEQKLFKFSHINSRYPDQFEASQLEKQQCDYAIFGYGQWMVATQTYPPCTAQCYEDAVRGVMKQVAPAFYQGPTKIFFLSMNYNGLRGQMVTCPAFDYRTPPVVDMLNDVMQRLCTEYKLPFIDMTHVMGPMWDSAEDFSHPQGKVYRAEIEWILHSIFSIFRHSAVRNSTHTSRGVESAEARKPAVPGSGMGDPSSVVEGSVVKFSHRDTLYTMRGGSLHALPIERAEKHKKTGEIIHLDRRFERKFPYSVASSSAPPVAAQGRGVTHGDRAAAPKPRHHKFFTAVAGAVGRAAQ